MSLLPQTLSFSKTLNPSPFSEPQLPVFTKPSGLPLRRFPLLTPNTKRTKPINPRCCIFPASNGPSVPAFSGPKPDTTRRAPPPPSAGRSKKKSGGRIEGAAELKQEARQNLRRRSQQLAESLFYRLKNPHKTYADNFSEEELQMIGLGYDRMVMFMEKDDPNLKHPYDWYKYGEFGPYSWRGIVVGDPVRGRFSDETVAMYGEVKDHEEFDKIEQHEMAVDFGKRIETLKKKVRFRYFWVFVRHPRWRVTDLPWEQWTLVAEVVLEAGNQRLDKWNLMGRLGNMTRSLITKCAAWMRPDIIYVKRPVYQCRFEPQDDFFRAIVPFLDPATENECLFELENDEGKIEFCTYFGGLCKMVKVSPKAFVDDVVKAYEKLSDQKKSKVLGFLLTNHPVQLLHPYTKEWKAKMEEEELGCDAPDDEDDGFKRGANGEKEFTDWVEDQGEVAVGNYDDDEEDDLVVDLKADDNDNGNGLDNGNGNENDEDDVAVDLKGDGSDSDDPEEDPEYWERELNRSLSSNQLMESFVKKSLERTNRFYEKVLGEEEGEKGGNDAFKEEREMRGKRAKVKAEEWTQLGYGPWRKRVKKSWIPPELFLRAAVRPFTYTNLVKEIVLTRHAIIEGEIGVGK